jgi:hypothetical protein
MANQRGFERRDSKAQSDAEEAKRDHIEHDLLRHDLPVQQHRAEGDDRRQRDGRPQCWLAFRREVKNDPGAVGDREPWQQPAGGQFLRDPFANARRRDQLDAPPISAPGRALPAAGPGQRPRLRPRLSPGAPGSPPCVLLPRRQSSSALKGGRQSFPSRARERNRRLWKREGSTAPLAPSRRPIDFAQ